MRFLVVGGGAREHAIGAALDRAGATVLVASSNTNPGLERIAHPSARIDPTNREAVVQFARAQHADAAVIGP
ncbi:MAG: phosphoribosylamine--glycine ligase, partial [Thermoplasmata archaeon]